MLHLDADAAATRRGAGADLAIEHVAKSYGPELPVLVDVSLRVRPGELVALTGPSGCGKSTLLNLVGALDRPDSGRITVDDESIPDLPAPWRYRRDTVGFVFQLHHLLPALTAQSNVEIPMIGAGVPRGERRARALELLEDVGVANRAQHVPSELSGGERQRVAIARALANEPRLLLADEPTGALDSDSSRRVLELLAGLQQRLGMTVLMVSYDPSLGSHADRVVRMLDGVIRDDVTPGRAQRPDRGG
jgi:putative ABC transport system ATP-binding protein